MSSFTLAPRFAQYLWQCCVEAGFRPKVSQQAVEAHSLISLVAAGFGVAVVPERIQTLAHPGVVHRPLHGTRAVADVMMIYRPDPSAVLATFLLGGARLPRKPAPVRGHRCRPRRNHSSTAVTRAHDSPKIPDRRHVAFGLTQDFFNRRLLQILCVIAKDFGAQRRAHAVALVAAGGRVVGDPVARDVEARRHPDVGVALHIIQKARQRRDAARPTDQATVQPHRHHPGMAGNAFGVEHVERILQVTQENWSPLLKPCGVAKRMSLASSV
jgi:hypothetical protein